MVNELPSALPSLPSLGEIASQVAADTVAPGLGAAVAAGTGLGSSTLTRAVIIILGLLFIAAGIFGFDKTREIIVQGTRTAATAA